MAASNSSRLRGRALGRKTPYSLRSRPRAGQTPAIPPSYTPTHTQLDAMKDIVGRTWQLHTASPLHQFSRDPSSLRSYSSQLSAQLLTLAGGGDRACFSVRMTSLPHFGMDGSDGLQVEISNRDRRRSGSVLCAILCLPTLAQPDPTPGREEFTSLPVLLVRGPLRLTSLFLQWLRMTFDCSVSPLLPSSLHLSTLMAHYACTETGGVGKKLEVVYSFPEGVCKAGLSTLTMELPWDSLEAFRTRCENLSVEEQRSTMMTYLTGPVTAVTHYKLDLLKVSRVSIPSCHLDSQGRVKFTSPENILPILSFLLQ